MNFIKRTTDEKELIQACLKGQARAQRALYDQHAPLMMSLCYRYAGDKDTAADILQDGFVKVFTKLASYEGAGSFQGWMRRVFVTTALEYLRQKDALRQSDPLENCTLESDEPDIVDQLSAEELLNCIQQLPDGYRTVFNLYAIEGYSHAEIAELLNITEATSRSQFMRARLALQKSVISLTTKHVLV